MSPNTLKQSLKERHITMIALGGVIGAGLFVGSGALIASAGPAAILSYIIGAIIVSFVMLMLGEMASKHPDSGSFSTYAHTYLGEWAGYTVGWLYWFKSLLTITLEAVLLGTIANEFLPWIPIWAGAFIMLTMLIGCNAFSVRSFGEVEYWLAAVKILAICTCIVFGLSILFGLHENIPSPGFLNLTTHDGFMPNGLTPVVAGIIVVIFALGGSEIAAIAAGESNDPQKNVIKAIKSVILRVTLFYVGSVIILVLCIPWTDKGSLSSPYVALFNLAGFNQAAVIMKLVIFVSFMSVMNSFLFSNSRMLFSLSQRGQAPALFARTTKKGVPLNALILTFIICSVILITNFAFGGDAFLRLAKSSGAFILLVWTLIVVTHTAMRIKTRHEPRDPKAFKLRMFPYANILCLASLMVVLGTQAANPDSRFQVWFLIIAVTLLLLTFVFYRKNKKHNLSPQNVPQET